MSIQTFTQTFTQAQAQKVVENHGHETRIVEGVLMGGIVFSYVQPEDSAHPLIVGIEWTPVPLERNALRDWLGY